MENLVKVSLNKGLRNGYIVKISFLGAVAVLAVILGIYSLTASKWMFAVWYFVAFILAAAYVVIRINGVFPPYIACDGEKVILSVWENGLVPYRIPDKPDFFSDFIPEKVKTDEIMLDDIDTVFIGSKKFLKRNLSEEEYPQIFRRNDGDKHFESLTRRMDFIYIRAKDKEGCFMSVTGFDVDMLAQFADIIEKNCTGVQIHTNLPKLVKIRNKRI